MNLSNAQTPPLLEPDQINGLLEAAGPEGTREILDAFWRSTSDLLEKLRTEAAAGSLDAAARTAHAIKGSAANVGAQRLADVAREIERLCKTGDAAAAADGLTEAAAAFDRTRSAFDAHIRAFG